LKGKGIFNDKGKMDNRLETNGYLEDGITRTIVCGR